MIEQIIRKIENHQSDSRILVALAGAPASGKSTLAMQIHKHFGTNSVILPMDGFHLDNKILSEQGLYQYKGAPETFDVQGFIDIVQRIKNHELVYAPEFVRELDLARAGAIAIAKQPIVIVEGNYLLFDQYPWNILPQYWNYAFFLDVSLDKIIKRCQNRWHDYGLPLAEINKRVQENDLQNAKAIYDNLVNPYHVPFQKITA